MRADGFAVVDSELEPGLVAIAAPIRSADGSVVAAVSVSGPSMRLTRQEVAAVVPRVREAAEAISIALRSGRTSPTGAASPSRRASTTRKGAA